MNHFLTKNDLFSAEFSYFRPLFWRGLSFHPEGCLSQMQGFCLALYRRNIEIFRGLGTRQVTQQLNKRTAKKRIKLTWGKWAIVDADDYERLNKYKWHAVQEGRGWYAKTLRRDGMPLAMHRLILNAPKGLFVDHIDHNGLNNRKTNLRLCTNTQNQRNRKPNRGGTSKYKGVYWHKQHKKYRASICHNKKRIHLGYFVDEIAAAKAYDKAAKKFFGEFAYLNFPDCHSREGAESRLLAAS